MQILGIEKLGNRIYGCLDDGVHYQVFSADLDCPVVCEDKYPKGDYDDYDSFTLYFCSVDPGLPFLEVPLHVGVGRAEELTYEMLLSIWNEIWASGSK